MKLFLCRKCHKKKPLKEFHKHYRDGIQYWCKDCKRQAAGHWYRSENGQRWHIAERRKRKNEEYWKRPEIRAQIKAHRKLVRSDPFERIKGMARWMIEYEVKKGRIRKLSCRVCGNTQSEAHHPNYTEPLKVIWLCRTCHEKVHAKYPANQEGN